VGPRQWRLLVDDPHAPLVASLWGWTRREWVFACFLIFLGSLMFNNPSERGALSPTMQMIVAGIIIGAGIFLLVRRWLPSSGARKTLVDIDERGVSFNLRKDQPPLHIPGGEVRGVERKSYIRFIGKWVAIAIREPSLVVSRDFYERNIHIENLWQRGPVWHLTFVADDKRSVMHIVLDDNWFDLPKRYLFQALVARWKAFGAPLSPEALEHAQQHGAVGLLDRYDEARASLMAVPAIRIAVTGLTLGACVSAWVFLNDLLAPRFNSYFSVENAGQFAAGLVGERKMPVRLADGRMVMIGYTELASMTARNCRKEKLRNPESKDRKTRYQDRNTCFMSIRLKDGAQGIGVFFVVQTYRMVDLGRGQTFEESRDEARAVALPEAQVLICAEGLCT
jgi:hypothetical protein